MQSLNLEKMILKAHNKVNGEMLRLMLEKLSTLKLLLHEVLNHTQCHQYQ